MANDITVAYRMTLDNYRVLCRLQRRLILNLRVQNRIYWLLVIFVGVLIPWSYLSGLTNVLVISSMLLIAWLGLRFFGTTWLTKRWFKQQRLDRHEIVLTLSEAGLSTVMGDSTSFHGWSELMRIDETDSHFVIWENRLLGFVVPKRSFPNADAVSMFADIAKRNLVEQPV